jgi:hypothetical protein
MEPLLYKRGVDFFSCASKEAKGVQSTASFLQHGPFVSRRERQYFKGEVTAVLFLLFRAEDLISWNSTDISHKIAPFLFLELHE